MQQHRPTFARDVAADRYRLTDAGRAVIARRDPDVTCYVCGNPWRSTRRLNASLGYLCADCEHMLRTDLL